MEKTVLVSCVSKKLCHKACAEDLYKSPWFELAMKYAKSLEPRLIFILSAKYGLTALSQEIEPYNLTLKEMGASEKKKWAARVLAELRCHCDLRNDRFVILAGNEYRKYLVPYMDHVKIPLEGLRIGEQLKWLKEQLLETSLCARTHQILNTLPMHRFPFDEEKIAQNGIYFLFEQGEEGHGKYRIVRVGTHTGENQLRSRLRQHFLLENKDRSIFRKNIGRALLSKDKDPFLDRWEIDLTPTEAKRAFSRTIDAAQQKEVEKRVSEHIQTRFRFVVVRCDDKQTRLWMESRIVSTISLCRECGSSPDWLGSHSPKSKIRESGVWQVNELYKRPMDEDDFETLRRLVEQTLADNGLT